MAEAKSSHSQSFSATTQSMPRWLPLLGGGALAAYGISRRSFAGAGLAAVGGAVMYRGIKSGANSELKRFLREGISVEKSVTINKSARELYDFWRKLENLPKFMRHLESIVERGEISHWVATGPLGTKFEWDAEITSEQPGSVIAWRSLPGSGVQNNGFVGFHELPAGRGTEIKVGLTYKPPAGRLGAAFAMIFGEEPEQSIREDLRRFKSLMETGEIPTIDGQSSGRRPKVLTFVKSLHGEGRPMPKRKQHARRIAAKRVQGGQL